MHIEAASSALIYILFKPHIKFEKTHLKTNGAVLFKHSFWGKQALTLPASKIPCCIALSFVTSKDPFLPLFTRTAFFTPWSSKTLAAASTSSLLSVGMPAQKLQSLSLWICQHGFCFYLCEICCMEAHIASCFNTNQILTSNCLNSKREWNTAHQSRQATLQGILHTSLFATGKIKRLPQNRSAWRTCQSGKLSLVRWQHRNILEKIRTDGILNSSTIHHNSHTSLWCYLQNKVCPYQRGSKHSHKLLGVTEGQWWAGRFVTGLWQATDLITHRKSGLISYFGSLSIDALGYLSLQQDAPSCSQNLKERGDYSWDLRDSFLQTTLARLCTD